MPENAENAGKMPDNPTIFHRNTSASLCHQSFAWRWCRRLLLSSTLINDNSLLSSLPQADASLTRAALTILNDYSLFSHHHHRADASVTRAALTILGNDLSSPVINSNKRVSLFSRHHHRADASVTRAVLTILGNDLSSPVINTNKRLLSLLSSPPQGRRECNSRCPYH